jgi:hypothetical protein
MESITILIGIHELSARKTSSENMERDLMVCISSMEQFLDIMVYRHSIQWYFRIGRNVILCNVLYCSVYMCIFVCMYSYVRAYVCMYACMYVCTYVRMYAITEDPLLLIRDVRTYECMRLLKIHYF